MRIYLRTELKVDRGEASARKKGPAYEGCRVLLSECATIIPSVACSRLEDMCWSLLTTASLKYMYWNGFCQAVFKQAQSRDDGRRVHQGVLDSGKRVLGYGGFIKCTFNILTCELR